MWVSVLGIRRMGIGIGEFPVLSFFLSFSFKSMCGGWVKEARKFKKE